MTYPRVPVAHSRLPSYNPLLAATQTHFLAPPKVDLHLLQSLVTPVCLHILPCRRVQIVPRYVQTFPSSLAPIHGYSDSGLPKYYLFTTLIIRPMYPPHYGALPPALPRWVDLDDSSLPTFSATTLHFPQYLPTTCSPLALFLWSLPHSTMTLPPHLISKKFVSKIHAFAISIYLTNPPFPPSLNPVTNLEDLLKR